MLSVFFLTPGLVCIGRHITPTPTQRGVKSAPLKRRESWVSVTENVFRRCDV